MTRHVIILAMMAAGPALAQSGDIGTLPQGEYLCETPGDATGPAGIKQDNQTFTVRNSSRYSHSSGDGTYLLTGDLVTMTSGPKKGQRFRRQSDNFLREIDSAGNDTPLRCVRRGASTGR